MQESVTEQKVRVQTPRWALDTRSPRYYAIVRGLVRLTLKDFRGQTVTPRQVRLALEEARLKPPSRPAMRKWLLSLGCTPITGKSGVYMVPMKLRED